MKLHLAKISQILTRENIEWILARLWPKPYVRITFFALIAGSALLAGPIWFPFIQAFSSEYLRIEIQNVDNPIAGVLVIVSTLFFFAFCFGLELRHTSAKEEQKRDHDIDVARKISFWMPEQKIEWILGTISSEHGTWSKNLSILDDFTYNIELPSCFFVYKAIESTKLKLAKSSKDLTEFIAQHFFPYGRPINDQLFLALYPELNIDRGGHDPMDTRYAEYSRELQTLVDAVKQDYRDLFLVIHKEIAFTVAHEV